MSQMSPNGPEAGLNDELRMARAYNHSLAALGILYEMAVKGSRPAAVKLLVFSMRCEDAAIGVREFRDGQTVET